MNEHKEDMGRTLGLDRGTKETKKAYYSWAMRLHAGCAEGRAVTAQRWVNDNV